MELIKRCRAALRKHASGLGWSIAAGVIGTVIGLLGVALWGHTVGW